jgi:fluoride ion exporter CrcB/FEX
MNGTNVRIAIAKDICLKNVQYSIDASHFIANITGFFVVVIFAEVCSSVRTHIKSLNLVERK